MLTKLYGGFVLNGKTLLHDPANPNAEWWVAVAIAAGYADPLQSMREAALVRPVRDGWEVWYSYYQRGYTLATQPPTAAELADAEPVLGQDLNNGTIHALDWLLRNKPILDRNTTGKPYRAPPGEKCATCRKNQAFVTLSAYSNSGTTSRVVRHFCRVCLGRGHKTRANNLICHICRFPGADKQIHWVAHPEGKGPYEFRTHDKCARGIAEYACVRPTMEERRPQRRVIVPATGTH